MVEKEQGGDDIFIVWGGCCCSYRLGVGLTFVANALLFPFCRFSCEKQG